MSTPSEERRARVLDAIAGYSKRQKRRADPITDNARECRALEEEARKEAMQQEAGEDALVAACPRCERESREALRHLSCPRCGHTWLAEGARDPVPAPADWPHWRRR